MLLTGPFHVDPRDSAMTGVRGGTFFAAREHGNFVRWNYRHYLRHKYELTVTVLGMYIQYLLGNTAGLDLEMPAASSTAHSGACRRWMFFPIDGCMPSDEQSQRFLVSTPLGTRPSSLPSAHGICVETLLLLRTEATLRRASVVDQFPALGRSHRPTVLSTKVQYVCTRYGVLYKESPCSVHAPSPQPPSPQTSPWNNSLST